MKIENQCCLLEQAKRLKELGVEQKSYFYHEFVWNTAWKINHLIDGSFPFYSAFSAAELGLMLPQRFCSYRQDFLHYKDVWVCDLARENTQYGAWYGYMDYLKNDIQTEAEARAEILIHLLEHEITTAEEVNKRLVNEEQKQVS